MKLLPAPEPADFRLESYHFDLPQKQIAQTPPKKRGDSKLLILDRNKQNLTFTTFSRLTEYIPAQSLLVANNSKVLPARIYGQKESGGKVEFLLLTPLPIIKNLQKTTNEHKKAKAKALLKATKRPTPGQKIIFNEDFYITVLEHENFGQHTVDLHWKGELTKLFALLGHYPLPPYIRRPDNENDAKRYQTIYASDKKNGSVAAPTAGLHFNQEMKKNLKKKEIQWAEVTLYVGYATFSPVRTNDIRNHKMHPEYIEINKENALKINQAKNAGKKIICIGTTSLRTLEGMFRIHKKIIPCKTWTDIYLYPGQDLSVTDSILTNFHLPQSSLIIMLSALAGRKNILNAYKEAIKNDFKFFSYGDAMLIL